jgi:hypothetical protein
MAKINHYNRAVGLIIVLILIILSTIYFYYTYFSTTIPISSTASIPIYVKEAYCDNNTHFNFTIVNNQFSSLELKYKWHLDDPKANMPRYIHYENGTYSIDRYIGNGNVTVLSNSSQTIVISLPRDLAIRRVI